jgi:hypothetical protein
VRYNIDAGRSRPDNIGIRRGGRVGDAGREERGEARWRAPAELTGNAHGLGVASAKMQRRRAAKNRQPYLKGHQPDFFFSGCGLYSLCISDRRTSNALPTFLLSLADDSMYAAPSFLARAWPSAAVTALHVSFGHSQENETAHRSPARSDFCATTTHGTFSRPAKSRILSWTVWHISNDCRDVMEKTSIYPCTPTAYLLGNRVYSSCH